MLPLADTDVNGTGERAEASIIRAPAILLLLFDLQQMYSVSTSLRVLQVRGKANGAPMADQTRAVTCRMVTRWW